MVCSVRPGIACLGFVSLSSHICDPPPGQLVTTRDMSSHLHSVLCAAHTEGPQTIAAGRPESQPMVTAIGCSPLVVSVCASHSIPCAPSLILVLPLISPDAEAFMARLSFPFGKTMREDTRRVSTRKCG